MAGRKSSEGRRQNGGGGRGRGRSKPAAAAPEGMIFGRHAVRAALLNPARRCRRLLVTKNAQADILADVLAQTLSGLAVETADARAIENLLGPDVVHQGVALVADPLPEPDLHQACAAPEARALVMVLDQITDPRNVGALLRSAAAFGVRAVVTTKRHAPPPTGTLAKAASGGLESVPYVRVANLARALETLSEFGYWRVGLDDAAGTVLRGDRISTPVALVLGSEGGGLRRLTALNCDELARLPTDPAMPSLNVSNAAAVALYELARRG